MKMGLALPDVEAGTAYGSPALKLHGQLLACVPTNKAAEPNSVVVRIDVAQRDEMLAAEPDVYYLKPHYEDVRWDALPSAGGVAPMEAITADPTRMVENARGAAHPSRLVVNRSRQTSTA